MNDFDAEIALAKAKQTQAEVQLTIAKQNLQALIVSPVDSLNGLDMAKVSELKLKDRTLTEWIEVAKQNNPEMQRAHHEIAIAQFEYEKNKAGHYPTLDFVVSRTRSESDTNITIGSRFDTTSGVLQLNVPIYTGGYINANMRQAAAMMSATKSDEQAKAIDLIDKITRTYSDMQNATALKSAYADVITAYQASLEGTRKAYAAGTKSLGDTLIIQDKLDEARLSLNKVHYDYMLNYLLLKELSGELKLEDLIITN